MSEETLQNPVSRPPSEVSALVDSMDLVAFIGTKVLDAARMTRGDYNDLRGWKIPADEDPNDAGRVVRYSDGYISWSPEETFLDAYKPLTGMSFGVALEAVKRGAKIARAGWNGKGMWITYSPGNPGLAAADAWSQNIKKLAIASGGKVNITPYLAMKTAAGDIQCGWLASQSDMLADDWTIVK
jgi:hypothetical protein